MPREKFDELVEKSKTSTLSFDEKQLLVEDMSYFGCTLEDVATLLNTTPYYLTNNFKDIFNRAGIRWRYDLRRAQATNAFLGNGNNTMLIWLGKQYLSQKDDPQLEIKKDKFDEFIEWMRAQPLSPESQKNNATSSLMPMHVPT